MKKVKIIIIILNLFLFGSSCKNTGYNIISRDPSPSPRNMRLGTNWARLHIPDQDPGPGKSDTVTIIDTAANNSLQKTIDELSEYILATSLNGGCYPVDTAAIAAIVRKGIKPTYISSFTRVTDSIPYIPMNITLKLAALDLNAREDAQTIDKQLNEISVLKQAKKRLWWILIAVSGLLLATFAGIYYFSSRKNHENNN